MEDDQVKDRITQLISNMEESKIDRMLDILHKASDDDNIDEKK